MFWNMLYAGGAVLTSLGGGAVIIAALSSWFGKLWASKILEADRAKYQREMQFLRDQIERGQYVHRLQYEVEFKGYQTLWEKLVPARAAAKNLRPVVDFVPKDKSKEEVQQERLEQLQKTLPGFINAFVLLEPFFPPSVYEAFCDLAATIRLEAVEYSSRDEYSHREYWDTAVENAKKIEAQSDAVRDAIRARIGNIEASLNPRLAATDVRPSS